MEPVHFLMWVLFVLRTLLLTTYKTNLTPIYYYPIPEHYQLAQIFYNVVAITQTTCRGLQRAPYESEAIPDTGKSGF